MSAQTAGQVPDDALAYALPWSLTHEWRMPQKWTPLSGKLAPRGMSWTPLDTYIHLPTKFPASEDIWKIQSLFHPENIQSLGVEVFYIWPPAQDQTGPVLLVPSGRLFALAQDINAVFPESQIGLPERPERIGLITEFPFHPHLSPRYLGFIRDSKSYHEIVSRVELGAVPAKGALPRGEPRTQEAPHRRALEEYTCKFNLIKKLVQSEQSLVELMEGIALQQQGPPLHVRPPSTVQKALERYLGLRPPKVIIDVSVGNNWEELQAAEHARLAAVKTPDAIDVNLPPPYPRKSAPVLLAFDIESYERDQRKVTEVGIATLDTADLQGASGVNGINWYNSIRARHFRIKENMHLVNRDFVNGCPDKFDFGLSEVISLKSAAEIVRACFQFPCPKSSEVSKSAAYSWDKSGGASPERPVIAVGHDPAGDIKWLASLGLDLHSIRNVDKTVVDTKILYRDMVQEKHFRSLAHILSKFDITAWNLHNAGNDATFTMQALLSIVVTSASERGTDAQVARIRVSQEEELERVARNARRNMQQAQAQRGQSQNARASRYQYQASDSGGGVRIHPQHQNVHVLPPRRGGKQPVHQPVESEEDGETDYI